MTNTTNEILSLIDNPPTVANLIEATKMDARNRKHMDHSDCSHPATTDDRTKCREAAKTAGTWPLPAPVAPPEPVHFYIGKGKVIHFGVGTDLVAACGTSGIRTGTDNAVTCRNCLKLHK